MFKLRQVPVKTDLMQFSAVSKVASCWFVDIANSLFTLTAVNWVGLCVHGLPLSGAPVSMGSAFALLQTILKCFR